MITFNFGAGDLGPLAFEGFAAVCDPAMGRTPFACGRPLFAAEEAAMAGSDYVRRYVMLSNRVTA